MAYDTYLLEICDPLRVLLERLCELHEPVQAALVGHASEFVLIGQCMHSHIYQAHVYTQCDACDGEHSDERSNYATCAYFKPMEFYLLELCVCLLECLAVLLAHKLRLAELCHHSLSIFLLRSRPRKRFR